VFPVEQTRHIGVAKSEHPRLTNGEINFEQFQPSYVITIHQRYRQTDGQTDGQTDHMRSQYLAMH